MKSTNTVETIKITSRSQTTQRPGLWAEREAQGPFRIERSIVTFNARGDAVQVTRETVAADLGMIEALTICGTFPTFNVTRSKSTRYHVLDATDHAVSLMDFALIHMGREGFDAAVNRNVGA